MPIEAEAVTRWFDAQASAYDGWDRWPWRAWREREAAAVMGAVGDVAGHDVLELGSGSGRFTRKLLAAGAREVVVVDLSREMLAQLPPSVTAVQGDAAAVQVGRRFRHLLSAGMLEFVPDARAVLANAARHAELGATLVLLVPRTSLGGRLYRRWHGRHGLAIRLFDRASLEEDAAAAGWRVDRVQAAPPFGLVARLRR